MKIRIKFLLFILTLTIITIFTGCTEFNISASIDKDNLVNYSYVITITGLDNPSENYNEAVSYLDEMGAHLDEAGFETTIEKEEGLLKMTSVIQKSCTSRQEAFGELYNCMTNSVSPFIDVEYEYNLNYYYEDYYLKANINLDGMVDDDVYEIYPSIVGDDIDEFLSSLKCTYTISLPENESTETDIITQKTITGSIPLDAQTEILVSGKINNNANVFYEKELLGKWNKNILMLAGGILITILAVIGIIIFSRAIKANNKEKPIE